MNDCPNGHEKLTCSTSYLEFSAKDNIKKKPDETAQLVHPDISVFLIFI